MHVIFFMQFKELLPIKGTFHSSQIVIVRARKQTFFSKKVVFLKLWPSICHGAEDTNIF